MVLGVSAGGVESAWPVATDAQCGKRFVAFAAPQTVAPSPPALEVSLVGDGQTVAFAANVRVKTASGARVSKVDLHRVRVADAAVSIDTMGPPTATIAGSSGGYTVVATPAGDPDSRSDDGREQPIGTITGLDTVPGSWKPVFYRAVAWGTDDADRGQYGVRSQASVARQVVVPPSTPPDLSPLTFVLPVAASANARVDCTTTAPVEPTTLGPHVLEADVVATDPAGVSSSIELVVAKAALDQLPTAEPGAGLSGLWRDPTVGATTALHLLVRRSDPATTLRARVRLTDPLGRITEHTIDVPVVPPVQPPDITNLTLTTVAGGTILAFTTAVPNIAAGFGPVPNTGHVPPDDRTSHQAQREPRRHWSGASKREHLRRCRRGDPDPPHTTQARRYVDRRRHPPRRYRDGGHRRAGRPDGQRQPPHRKGGALPVSEITSMTVLTAADAANQLQSKGLDALGLTMPAFASLWSTGSTTADDTTLHLSLTSPRAPFTGTFRLEASPVTLAGVNGDPITTPSGVLRLHPEAVHRLESLVRERYTVLQRPVPVAMVVHGVTIPAGPQLMSWFRGGDDMGLTGAHDVSFHDRRGLIIDPVAVAALLADLMLFRPALVAAGAGGSASQPGGIATIANLAGPAVRVHVVSPHGAAYRSRRTVAELEVIDAAGTFVRAVPASGLVDLAATERLGRATAHAPADAAAGTPLLWGLAPGGTMHSTPLAAPPLPTTGSPPNPTRQFFRVVAVDLGWHLLGNRDIAPGDAAVPGETGRPAEAPIPIGSQERVDLRLPHRRQRRPRRDGRDLGSAATPWPGPTRIAQLTPDRGRAAADSIGGRGRPLAGVSSRPGSQCERYGGNPPLRRHRHGPPDGHVAEPGRRSQSGCSRVVSRWIASGRHTRSGVPANLQAPARHRPGPVVRARRRRLGDRAGQRRREGVARQPVPPDPARHGARPGADHDRHRGRGPRRHAPPAVCHAARRRCTAAVHRQPRRLRWHDVAGSRRAPRRARQHRDRPGDGVRQPAGSGATGTAFAACLADSQRRAGVGPHTRQRDDVATHRAAPAHTGTLRHDPRARLGSDRTTGLRVGRGADRRPLRPRVAMRQPRPRRPRQSGRAGRAHHGCARRRPARLRPRVSRAQALPAGHPIGRTGGVDRAICGRQLGRPQPGPRPTTWSAVHGRRGTRDDRPARRLP